MLGLAAVACVVAVELQSRCQRQPPTAAVELHLMSGFSPQIPRIPLSLEEAQLLQQQQQQPPQMQQQQQQPPPGALHHLPSAQQQPPPIGALLPQGMLLQQPGGGGGGGPQHAMGGPHQPVSSGGMFILHQHSHHPPQSLPMQLPPQQGLLMQGPQQQGQPGMQQQGPPLGLPAGINAEALAQLANSGLLNAAQLPGEYGGLGVL